ncbi:MAG: SusC/RagA family TonB-linked outer membrane protein [Rhodothermaceae bacterium]|nr:MAG: SusC/RagA family TonB-linked outer membrane protein [Rhodothermaceae bacterium]
MNHRNGFVRLGALLVLLGLATGTVRAQTVRGTVTDAASGEPLPGVNVSVRGTTIGTTTDVDGNYALDLPPGNRTLVFSFVGFRTREVAVPPGQNTLDVQLEEDVLGLDEVVVTGLATSVKRTNLANAVATVSARELAGVTTSQTLDGALSGKVPGALISSYSGAPGGGLTVKLRGISTINGNAQPLYVVDGLIVDNSAIQSGVDAVTNATGGGSGLPQDNPVNRIADLNPEDIESVEILKGASAAAIYGARASNGVVIIRTKRGTAGRARVRYSQSVGAASIIKKLGVRRFTAETAEQFFGERGRQEFQAAQAGRGFIDYEEEMYGHTGLLWTSSLSISGGNEQTQFYVSGMVKDDEGIVRRTGYEKQSVRVNVDHRFSEKARLSTGANYIRAVTRRGLTGNDNAGTTFGISLAATPNFIDLRPDANGNYPDHPFNSANPLQTRDLMTNEETVNRMIASAQFQYNLVQTQTQLLQFIAEGGVDFYALNNVGFFPVELQFERLNVDRRGPGTSILRDAASFNTTWRGLLVHTYNAPASGLSLTTQAGLIGTDFDLNTTLSIADGLVPGSENIDLGASLSADQRQEFQRDRSFFVQEEVNFSDRIIATVGLRGDKTSLNGDVNTFNLYPKASLALNLTNFPFWRWSFFEQFKLRAAFGQTGNIAGFGIKFTTFDPIAIGGNVGTIIGTRRGFSDVKPERQTEIEAGLDLAALNGRASLEATVYRKVITDQLLQREVEPSTGFALETFNGGELVNRGLELALTFVPVEQESFRWLSRTSFWLNRAEVTELPVPAFRALGGGFGATLGEIRIEEGKSPTQIVGIDDKDGDGTPDGTFQLGDVAPDFQMSFWNEFTIAKNLTLSVFAHWKQGGDVLNLTELLTDLFGTSPDFDDDDDGDGISNGNERLNMLGVSAKQFVQDASYFRIREIGLHYNVPLDGLPAFLNRNVRSLSIGVSAKNPITLTPYKSYDPEVNNFGTQPVADGVEVTPYPSFRTVLFHLSIEL